MSNRMKKAGATFGILKAIIGMTGAPNYGKQASDFKHGSNREHAARVERFLNNRK